MPSNSSAIRRPRPAPRRRRPRAPALDRRSHSWYVCTGRPSRLNATASGEDSVRAFSRSGTTIGAGASGGIRDASAGTVVAGGISAAPGAAGSGLAYDIRSAELVGEHELVFGRDLARARDAGQLPGAAAGKNPPAAVVDTVHL